jgi:anti-anti-sigma regulatory factor
MDVHRSAPPSASVVRPDAHFSKLHVTGYARKRGCHMASLLRHRVGRSFPDDVTLPRPAITTLVSRCGTDHTDRSFLLVRERSIPSAAGHRLILRGIFDEALHVRLHTALSTVSGYNSPLTLDLRDVTFLDESCLRLLVRARRDCSQVVFRLPSEGPIVQMTAALGPLPKSLPKRHLFEPSHSPAAGSDSASAVLQA